MFGQILAVESLVLLAFITMKNRDDFYDLIIPSSFVMLGSYAAFYSFQVYLSRLFEEQFDWSLLLSWIGPLTSIALNNFKYGSDQKTMYAILTMINYHTIFEAQGAVNTVWRDKLKNHSDYYRNSAVNPFIIIGTLFAFSIVLPTSYSNIGFVFFYPIYDNTYI